MAYFLMQHGASFGKISARARAELLGSKSVQVVKFYLDNGGTLDNIEENGYDLFTVLTRALASNRTVMKYLFERNAIAPDMVLGADGKTLLYAASMYSNNNLSIKLLLAYGANPNYVLPTIGLTPSFQAIMQRHPATVIILLKSGATGITEHDSATSLALDYPKIIKDHITLQAFRRYAKKQPREVYGERQAFPSFTTDVKLYFLLSHCEIKENTNTWLWCIERTTD